MPEAVLLVEIDAAPAVVRQAISTRDGIVNWWTTDATVPTAANAVIEVGFPDAPAPFQLRVDALSDERICWTSVGEFPPHWQGTEVVFNLNATQGGTQLFFEHRGFAAADPALGHTAFTWAQLMVNLKKYAEGDEVRPMFGKP